MLKKGKKRKREQYWLKHKERIKPKTKQPNQETPSEPKPKKTQRYGNRNQWK